MSRQTLSILLRSEKAGMRWKYPACSSHELIKTELPFVQVNQRTSVPSRLAIDPVVAHTRHSNASGEEREGERARGEKNETNWEDNMFGKTRVGGKQLKEDRLVADR